jgi:hypothetical protein
MLQTLDTIIAFAVIMTVLSMVITILVQMFSAALALRGKNLANALSLTFQTIDPNLKEHAHALAEHILKDPIFSDSIFRSKDRGALAIPDTKLRTKPWSLWDLRLYRTTTLATAVRPGEVYRLLYELKDLADDQLKQRGISKLLKQGAVQLFKELAKEDGPAKEAKEKLKTVGELAKNFTPGGTPAELQKAVVDALGNFANTVERATTLGYDRFQRWFGSAQDRAEQWFQLHVRGITIALSIIAAVLLQLDTIEIFRQLRNSPHLVRALVDTAAPAVLDKSATVLDPTDNPAHLAYQKWLRKHPMYALDALPPSGKQKEYQDAIQKRIQTAPNDEYALRQFDAGVEKWRKTDGVTTPPSEADAVKAAYSAWIQRFPDYELQAEPDWATGKRESVRTELVARLAERHRSEFGTSEEQQRVARARWISDYEAMVNEATTAFLEGRRELVGILSQEIEKAGFDLIPKKLFNRWNSVQRLWPGHRIGILITAGLLTLGAPFWFNLLKNLMSLRPAVARLIERRPQSAPALPSAPTSSAPSN